MYASNLLGFTSWVYSDNNKGRCFVWKDYSVWTPCKCLTDTDSHIFTAALGQADVMLISKQLSDTEVR